MLRRETGAVEDQARQEPSGIAEFGPNPESRNNTWHTCLGTQDQIKQAGLKPGLHLGFFYP